MSGQSAILLSVRVLLLLVTTGCMLPPGHKPVPHSHAVRIFPPDDVSLRSKNVALHGHAYQLAWKMDSLPGEYIRYDSTQWYTDASATLRLYRDGKLLFERTLTKGSLNQDEAFNRKARMFRLWYAGYSPNSGQFRFRLTVCVPESDWCQDHCVLIDTSGNYALKYWPESPEAIENPLLSIKSTDFTLDQHPLHVSDSMQMIAWFGPPKKVARPAFECGFFSEQEQGRPFFELHYPGTTWIGNGQEGFSLKHLSLQSGAYSFRYQNTSISAGMHKEALCNLFGIEIQATDSMSVRLDETEMVLEFLFEQGKLVEIALLTPC